MTSLIDVIFLLLLFFMLSSTFSRFAEVELTAVAHAAGATADGRPVFLQLSPNRFTINGAPHALDDLGRSRLAQSAPGSIALLSLQGPVTAQRLADALVSLRDLPDLTVTVLER